MASRRHVRRRACEGKRRFDDPEAANRAASLTWAMTTVYFANVHVYRCSADGSHWHVGHAKKGTSTRA